MFFYICCTLLLQLFLACLYNLQAVNILNEIDRDQLFSNVPEIYKSNQILWLDCILPMVQKARNTNQPMDPNDLGNGFLQVIKYLIVIVSCIRTIYLISY